MADDRVIIEIDLDDGQVKRAFAGVEKRAERSGKKLDNVFNNTFSSIGRAAAALAPIIAGAFSVESLRRSLLTFAEYERSLVGVQKTTDISGQQLQALGRQFQNLSETIPVSANELLRLAEIAGQFGITGTKNIENFADTVAKLQFTIEGVDPETAAQDLTRLLNITGQGIENIDELGSVLVQLGNTFEANEGQILNATSRIAQATAGFGLAAQEITALGAALQAVGVRAEAGGTAVGKTFRQIQKAIDTGGKELREFNKVLGLTTEEIRQNLAEDPVQIFQALLDGLARLESQGITSATALRRLGLDSDRVVATLAPLAQNTDKVREALRSANAEFSNATALETEFGRANQTLSAQIERLGNSFTNLFTAIGEFISGPGRDYIQFTTDAVQATTRFIRILSGDQVEILDRSIENTTNQIRKLQRELAQVAEFEPDIFGNRRSRQTDIVESEIEFLRNKLKGLNQERLQLLGGESNQTRSGISAGQNVAEGFSEGLNQTLSNSLQGEELERFRQQFVAAVGGLSGEGQLLQLQNQFLQRQQILVQGLQNELITRQQFDQLTLDNIRQNEEQRLNILAQAGDRQAEILINTRKQIQSGFVSGISQSFAALGGALQRGTNAFSAFGNAILGVLGDIAIQIGTTIVTAGKAIEALAASIATGLGGFAIVGGLALIALGGFLKSLAGAGGGQAIPGFASGAGGGVIDGATGTVPIEETAETDDRTAVTVNVEGTVIDPKTTGLQIAEVLQEAFDSTGVRLVNV